MSKFRYFTNDFNTNTNGIDLVVSTSTDWMGGTTSWNLAYNKTTTDVELSAAQAADQDVLDRKQIIEDMTPDTRWNLSANHMVDEWRMMARVSSYSDWYDSNEGNYYGADVIVDLEVSYNLNDSSTILIGGNNVLDETGDDIANTADSYGNLSSQFSPMGFSGAFWYAKYSYNF